VLCPGFLLSFPVMYVSERKPHSSSLSAFLLFVLFNERFRLSSLAWSPYYCLVLSISFVCLVRLVYPSYFAIPWLMFSTDRKAMHLKEIILDGFKSYATRTVISGWDERFNAITGLNGSGKSNVLDSICFVLGITNLSQVFFLPYPLFAPTTLF
jgi:hypothetical protein